MPHFTTVFLSSTAKDLQPYRDAVFEAILKLDGHHCVRMEDFGAVDGAPAEVCRAKVAACDVFVGLVGHLHGSRPEGSDLSYTELEYKEARDGGKVCLMFLAAEDFPVPYSLWEDEEARRRQKRFREQVASERVVVAFREPQKLATMVVTALQSHQAERHRQGSEAAAKSQPAVDRHETALRTAYLSRVMEQTGFVALSGVDPAVAGGEREARLGLQTVYTALMTLTPRKEGRLAGGLIAEENAQLAEERVQPEGRGAVSALEQLNAHPRLVLLGDPGSGKSTFINFVALCLAGEAMGRSDVNLSLLRAPLPGEEERRRDREPGPQPWEHGALWPVRIVLRDFAARGLPAAGARATAKDLWQFLDKELADAGLAECFALTRRELLAGHGLVLLDGLDEVPEVVRRREQIRQAVEDFCRALGTSRVLLTSRTYAYQNQAWRLPGFVEAVLAPFTRGQIERFVGLWYEQMVGLGRLRGEDSRGRAELLRRGIFGSDRLLALAERPLLLTLMASLHAWRGGSLPERREELYAEAVDLLLNRWERQRLEHDGSRQSILLQPSLAEWLRVDRQEVRQVLEEVAFEAHRAQPELAGTADVEEGKLVGRLLHLSRNPGADAVQLVTYLRDRAGLLLERGGGVYTFAHRTLQEYLAACHLTGGSFPEEAARLGREDPGRWREVVLLAGAKAARGAVSGVWSLADALCFREPGSAQAGPADEWGALLGGQAVAESADLGRVSEANQVKLERLRRWLVHLMRLEGFPVRERAGAGTALAVLGDPRFDPARWFLPKDPWLGFVEIAEGAFPMGSNKENDAGASSAEEPRHVVTLPRYWIGRFPVTVAQYRSFVEASGYEPADRRCLEGAVSWPVANVTWQDAVSYCVWLGERLSELEKERVVEGGDQEGFWADVAAGRLKVSLASEAEWEKAARGTDGRVYPWGYVWDVNRANAHEAGLYERSAVGCFPRGSSPNGCEEMSGNVWEWTRSLWGEDFRKASFVYPYVASDGREDMTASPQVLRVLRGGAFYSSSEVVRCADRDWLIPDARDAFIGFRVVLSPFRSDL